MKHTAGEWVVSTFKEYPEQRGGYFIYSRGRKPCIAKLFTTGEHRDYNSKENEAQANAAFIVQACNSHYDLLEACEEVFDLLTKGAGALYSGATLPVVLAILKTALAKARRD